MYIKSQRLIEPSRTYITFGLTNFMFKIAPPSLSIVMGFVDLQAQYTGSIHLKYSMMCLAGNCAVRFSPV